MACKPALKQMRREVWECACQVSPTLRKVARDAVEYAYEPLDGFHNILEEARSNGGSAAEVGALPFINDCASFCSCVDRCLQAVKQRRRQKSAAGDPKGTPEMRR
jgi:hypothetical protein